MNVGTVRLIAEREVKERLKAKSFRISTLVAVGIVVVAIVLPKVRSGHKHIYTVAAVGGAPAPIREVVDDAARIGGVKAAAVPVSDGTDGRARIRAGKLDVLIDGPEIVVRKRILPDGSGRSRFVLGVEEGLRIRLGLGDEGVAPNRAEAAIHARPLPIVALEKPKTDDTARSTAFFGIVLLFVLLTQYGFIVLSGVVEEKTTRVVEVLLSAVRPRELLAGKVIGIGITALAQALAVLTAGLVAASVSGSKVLTGKSPGTAGWAAIWFLLGYAFYCSVYGAVGSLVSRQEEAQNAAFPVQLPLLVAYVVAFPIVLGGDVSPVVRLLGYLPPTAPIAMPALIGAGQVSTVEILSSLALTLAATVLLVRVAGNIYARAILHTGRRLKIKEALKLPG